MRKGKRRTWPLALLGLGALTAGAWFISEPSLERDLQGKAAGVVQAAGGKMEVAVQGRDLVLKGEAPSAQARDALVAKVLAEYGVRRVDASALKVAPAPQPEPEPKPEPEPTPKSEPKPEPVKKAAPKPAPVPPPPPTVKAMLTNKAQPQITGTITAPEKVKQLKVELAGQTYTEGDGHLKRTGDAWVLVPAQPLPEGVHDVKVIAIGEGGASATDRTKDEITVDLTPPAKPVVEELRLAGTQAIMRGTWPEGDGKMLRIIVGDAKYDSDDPNGPLKTDGKGHFVLMLPASSLPAMRNATILTADAAGNVAEGEKPANLGNTCQQQLDDVLIQDMIHFETGKADISEDSLLLLDRLAKVLKGCPDMHVEIVGHTDNVGALQSNQQLSEARANAVKQALVARGLSADSIIARGEGETQPLVPNNSDRNRQINRRIEIIVKPKE